MTSELMLESASRLQAAPVRLSAAAKLSSLGLQPDFNFLGNPLRQLIAMMSSRSCHTSTVTNITVTLSGDVVHCGGRPAEIADVEVSHATE